MPIQYYQKENTGQGFSRNIGVEKSNGKYVVFFDSDCLIPEDYFTEADKYLSEFNPDAWGGPDKAHSSFTDFQKAVAFTMSSILTTGGIRGKKNHMGKFQPRSFNMGMKRDVFLSVKGFKQTNLGEDIELSTRLMNEGFKTSLFPNCFVYHKRRDTLDKFVQQAFSFGRGRIINSRTNKGALKLVHLFPLLFLLGFISIPFWYLIDPVLSGAAFLAYTIYFLLVSIFALIEYQSISVAFQVMPVSFLQLTSYAVGMLSEWTKKSKKV